MAELADHIDEVRRSGYTIIDDVVPEAQLSELREAVEAAIVDDWDRYRGRPGAADFISLDLVGHGGPFLELLDNEVYDQVFGAFLGERWVLYSFTSTVVRPHGDQYTCNIHTDTGRIVPDYDTGLLGTLAIDDFTFENGTTWFLPGSHLWQHPEPPSEDEFYSKAVRFERPAGSVVYFHPRIWHAGGSNDTEDTRYGCTMYGCRSFMKQRFDFPRLVEHAGLDTAALNERQRRVLGFNVRVPTSLDEFYVEPEHRLYLGGQG